MTADTKRFRRQSARYRGYDYSQPGAYFVTMVTRDHLCLFGKLINGKIHLDNLGKIVNDCWCQIPNHFNNIEVEPYIVMPNHIHGIITIINNHRRGTIYRAPTIDNFTSQPNNENYLDKFGKPVPGSLATVIRTYKAAVSRLARRELHMVNIWQRNYYEHIVRDEHELDKIVSYILANPDQWMDDPETIL